MSVTVKVVVDDVKATVEGVKLQLLFGGMFAQIDGERVPLPVKAFCAVKVRVADPD